MEAFDLKNSANLTKVRTEPWRRASRKVGVKTSDTYYCRQGNCISLSGILLTVGSALFNLFSNLLLIKIYEKFSESITLMKQCNNFNIYEDIIFPVFC